MANPIDLIAWNSYQTKKAQAMESPDMQCPQYGSEMIEVPGLTKTLYCSVGCAVCVEDINLEGAANRLNRHQSTRPSKDDQGGRIQARDAVASVHSMEPRSDVTVG